MGFPQLPSLALGAAAPSPLSALTAPQPFPGAVRGAGSRTGGPPLGDGCLEGVKPAPPALSVRFCEMQTGNELAPG